MGEIMSEWQFYLPDDGETASDAVPIIGKVWDKDDAANMACEYDFTSRDGWKRGESEFQVVVIAPDGGQYAYTCWHEPSVEHRARPK